MGGGEEKRGGVGEGGEWRGRWEGRGRRGRGGGGGGGVVGGDTGWDSGVYGYGEEAQGTERGGGMMAGLGWLGWCEYGV